jgi:hypothetical protein
MAHRVDADGAGFEINDLQVMSFLTLPTLADRQLTLNFAKQLFSFQNIVLVSTLIDADRPCISLFPASNMLPDFLSGIPVLVLSSWAI